MSDMTNPGPSIPGPMLPGLARMDGMSAALARNWWAVAARGVFAILFGLAAFLLPIATLGTLVLLFAIYLLVDGVFAIVAGVRAAAHHERWGLLIVEGVVNLLGGVAAVLVPGLAVWLLVTVLGVWAAVSGVTMLVSAFRLHSGHGLGLLLLSGLVSLVWGALLWFSPVAGALVLTWWLGGYALAFGVVLLVLGLRLRGRRGGMAPG